MDKDIILKREYLPDTIDEIHEFILIGKEVLVAQKAKIRALDKIGATQSAKKAALSDTQDIAEILLDVEVKLGGMLSSIPDKKASSGRGTRSLPEGINKKESHYAQQMFNNVEVVERVKAAAKEEGSIATEKEVLREIKKQDRQNEITQQRKNIEEGNIILPEGKFEVIVIDPPWDYDTKAYDPINRRGIIPYPSIPTENLKQIQIPAAENCVMWLWTTHQFIWDAKDIMDVWGFEYKSILVWDKEKMGVGKWLRKQVEFCLLGIKGKPIIDLTSQRDIIYESRREHSRKPECFYEMVEEVCVGRKLDYFSRSEREGWQIYGNDTTKF